MILSLSSCLVAGVALVLPAEKRVSGLEIRVAELADLSGLSGADAATLERVRSFSLGYAPAPGYTRVLQRWQVERDLETAFPALDFTVRGAEACRVIPQTQVLDAASIQSAAERELTALFGAPDATIRLQGATLDVEIPKPRDSSKLRAVLERREPRAGAWSVPVEIWVDETLYQTVWIAFEVELLRELPVLVRKVARGEYLSPSAVELRRTRVSSELAGVPIPASALAGAIATRDLVPGAVLTDRDVERARVVRTGDVVELLVRKGPITARASAVAKQDAYLGDKVRVVAANQAREMTAIAVGRQQVEIDLTSTR